MIHFSVSKNKHNNTIFRYFFNISFPHKKMRKRNFKYTSRFINSLNYTDSLKKSDKEE